MSVTWIEASAGTGKTFTLVSKVVDLLKGGLPAENVLLVTFTEKATAELKTRIRTELRRQARLSHDALLLQALEDLPLLTVATIHGFCRALLTQFPLESDTSFAPELVDQGRQWRRLLRDQLRSRLETLGNQLGWAELEDEEALLAMGQSALERGVFARPVAHPTLEESAQFRALTREWEAKQGPFWKAVEALQGLPWPEDAASLCSPEDFRRCVSRADWLRHPYGRVKGLAQARTHLDLLALCDDKSLEYLAKWSEGSTLWKKGDPELPASLQVLRDGAESFVSSAQAILETLPAGTTLKNFLRGSARHAVLAELCVPVLEQHSTKELTFHDLIDRVHRLVTRPEGSALKDGAAKRWKAVLIDEFQDTDSLQWEIFSSLFLTAEHELVLVGDPKQSIYRFRGADLALYRRVRDEVIAHGAVKQTLSENFRSTAAMVASVNQMFDPATTAWEHSDDFTPSTKGNKPIGELVGPDGVLPPLAVFGMGDERTWHRHLVDTAVRLLAGGFVLDDGVTRSPLVPSDLLFLVRTKREAWVLHRQLSARGLPAVVGGSGGLLNTREAREVLLFLKALESPRSLSAARALAWTRLLWGARPETLAAALEEAQDDRRTGAFLKAFRRVAAQLEPQVTDGGGLEGLLGHPGGTRVVTNAEQVLELVQERWHRGEVPLGRAALSLETWMESRLQEDEVDLRRDGERKTIRLMTVHAAKGLEAPVVFHGYPSSHRGFSEPWILDEGADFLLTQQAREAEARNQRADDLRLTYVARTRARTHQVLFDPLWPEAPAIPSPDEGEPARWTAPAPPVPELGPAMDHPELRHPWVESHSGLWRRATRDEVAHTVWDRPRVNRDDEGEAPLSLADSLPAGLEFGDLVHDVLEEVDFTAWAPGADPQHADRARAVVEEHCHRRRSSFGGRDLTKALVAWLSQSLNQPLLVGLDELTFTRLAPAETRRELEFHLPLSLSRATGFVWGERAFTIHPGFLTGRIDLLFRWKGRLYLADWKTNRLAPGQSPEELMREAGYDLQAHWYWEALQRLCRLQNEPLVPGGVLYVFLRGESGPQGVFLSPEALSVATLSGLLNGGEHG